MPSPAEAAAAVGMSPSSSDMARASRLSFATAMADMAAERGEPQVPMGLIGSCEHHIHRCLALVLL